MNAEENSSGTDARVTELVQGPLGAQIRRYLRSGLGEQDVDDVFQRVVVALRAAGPIDNLEAWCRTIAKRKLVDVLRSRTRRRAREQRLSTMEERRQPGSIADPEAALRAAQRPARVELRQTLLDEAMSQLSASDRQIVQLRSIERLAAKEIAARLGISKDAVRQRCHRALGRLKSLARVAEVRHVARSRLTAAEQRIIDLVETLGPDFEQIGERLDMPEVDARRAWVSASERFGRLIAQGDRLSLLTC